MGEKIAVFLGSKSDLDSLKETFKIIDEVKIPYKLYTISAHRNPEKLRRTIQELKRKKVEVVIACAGLAAALPGFLASYLDIPVIGVPMPGGLMDGLDSLLSIVQVPKGIGLVSSGFGKRGLINAFIFALQILSLKDRGMRKKLLTLQRRFKG